MTWDELVKLEPRLKMLLEIIRQAPNNPWFGQFGYKASMSKLVGVGRLYRIKDGDNSTLYSSAAYDCAYKVLYEASNKR